MAQCQQGAVGRDFAVKACGQKLFAGERDMGITVKSLPDAVTQEGDGNDAGREGCRGGNSGGRSLAGGRDPEPWPEAGASVNSCVGRRSTTCGLVRIEQVFKCLLLKG